jgi:hypothetical protein
MKPSDLVTERLETLLLARLSTLNEPKAKPPKAKPPKAKPPKAKPSKAKPSKAKALTTVTALASDVHRFAPATVDVTQWRDRVEACLQSLQDRGVVDAELRVRRADEFKQRTGSHEVQRWQQWPERILPGLAIGVRADDAKAHQRLSDRDAWAAAIVARVQGLWTKGPPPTLPKVCDALTWRALGLPGTPKGCPAEVRAHFLRLYVEIDAAPPERMVRQLAAKLIGAPRADLKALRLALIQAWLTGYEPEAQPAEPPPSDAHRAAPVPVAVQAPSLIDAVRSAARAARDGVFGDRKVFISSVWHALRATPPWSQLALDDFKARLVSAHRQRELELARADLVAAMDPTLVAASETRTDGATFHFIVREPVQ